MTLRLINKSRPCGKLCFVLIFFFFKKHNTCILVSLTVNWMTLYRFYISKLNKPAGERQSCEKECAKYQAVTVMWLLFISNRRDLHKILSSKVMLPGWSLMSQCVITNVNDNSKWHFLALGIGHFRSLLTQKKKKKKMMLTAE